MTEDKKEGGLVFQGRTDMIYKIIVIGDPAEEILNYVQSEGIGLVIMGTVGKTIADCGFRIAQDQVSQADSGS